MSLSAHRPYASPQALNRALTDKLGAHARDRPGVTLDLLRRQFAYDRLLTRVFAGPDATRWVLKGATAILARLAGDARHTRDIDLYRQDDDLPAAENSLRAAAATDVADFFRFTLDPAQRITQDRNTLRVSVIAASASPSSSPSNLRSSSFTSCARRSSRVVSPATNETPTRDPSKVISKLVVMPNLR
ncbi:MAG: nucleotidyl transferase AbiEii/AbiGii toxin family protein [Pseudonocardiaceae bacterium]